MWLIKSVVDKKCLGIDLLKWKCARLKRGLYLWSGYLYFWQRRHEIKRAPEIDKNSHDLKKLHLSLKSSPWSSKINNFGLKVHRSWKCYKDLFKGQSKNPQTPTFLNSTPQNSITIKDLDSLYHFHKKSLKTSFLPKYYSKWL